LAGAEAQQRLDRLGPGVLQPRRRTGELVLLLGQFKSPLTGDLKQDAHDQAPVGTLWTRTERPARFTLPIRAPLSPVPESKTRQPIGCPDQS
jgi:hypothetical protein